MGTGTTDKAVWTVLYRGCEAVGDGQAGHTQGNVSRGGAWSPSGRVTVAWNVMGVSKKTPAGRPGTNSRSGVASDMKYTADTWEMCVIRAGASSVGTTCSTRAMTPLLTPHSVATFWVVMTRQPTKSVRVGWKLRPSR